MATGLPPKACLYRLPWSLNDNPIAWLEVTDVCNFACPGCYRQTMTGHKSLDALRTELDVFQQWRNPDCVSIAGGEPLLHPEIEEIVAAIAGRGLKPIILTNAHLLDDERIDTLAQAGLAGFTLHIDSNQTRPGISPGCEADLNPLRQHYIDLIHARGGLTTYVNLTVFPHTVAGVADVVMWARSQPEKVDGVICITFRHATTSEATRNAAFEQRAALAQLTYVTAARDTKLLDACAVHTVITRADPEYDPCAYLGGTARHDSYKWLVAATIGTRAWTFGSLGPRSMELAQVLHHLWYGTYVSYRAKAWTTAGVFVLGLFDPAMRRAAGRWLQWFLRNPLRLFRRLYLQSVVIVQPPDILPDGAIDMCDSCPDMTVHAGELVNSCRLDECRLLGCMRATLGPAVTGENNE